MNKTQVEDVPAEKKSRVRAFIARIPTVLIAIVLSAVALVIAHFWEWGGGYFVPLVPFLPGAVQRANGRHLLVALGCAVLAFACQRGLHYAGVESFYLLSYIAYPAATMLLVGLMEWWLRGRPGRHQLISVLAACLGAAAIFAIVQTLILATQKTISVPSGGGWVVHYSVGNLVYFPLEAVLLWQAISMGLSPSVRRRSIVLGAAAAALTLYLACFTKLIFDEARRSLVGEGPLSRAAAADLLAQRANPGDLAALWDAVETADWDQPAELGQADYRYRSIDLLAKRDPAETAKRLAALLDSDNKLQLADVAAPLLAKYHEYDAVPVLLRFACCNDETCVAALEQMKVPQVAFALLLWTRLSESVNYENQQLNQGESIGTAPSGGLKVPEKVRKQLVDLLGNIKGDTIDDWEKHYNEVIDKLPTPLTKQQAELADRVVRAINKLWLYKSQWGKIKQHRIYTLAIKQMRADGLGKLADLIEASVKSNADKLQIPLPKKATPLYEALETLDKYIGQVSAQVTEPNINIEVEGVDGLQREVDKYDQWVREQAKIEFPGSEKRKVKSEK